MLDDRKAAILRAVVQEYIHTAQPVGSSHVAALATLSVSSATVRNEMAWLEREGYLVQPHTSAGRIPTDQGYRFFVDQLAPGTLAPAQRQAVRDFFARASGEIERTLGDTTRLLAGLTDSLAVVVRPAQAATVRSVQVVGLGPRVALVVAVLSNGDVEKRTLELGAPTGDERLAAASARLAAALSGRSPGHPASVPASGDAAVDAVVAAALRALAPRPDAGADVFVGGADRLASALDALESVRSVLAILEQQYVVVAMLRDVLDRGLTVAIGSEHGVEPLAGCSVVVAPYGGEGDAAGTIGVLGPTRMDYTTALAAVRAISQRLDLRLSEG